jgi:ribulose-phosphate 3-epimerase
MRIMASMLTSDMARMGEQVRELAAAGVDGIHWDLMDGKAVPGFSFGPPVIAACRPHTVVEFEAHVMVRDPSLQLLEQLGAAGCAMTMLHPDMLSHPWRAAEQIHDLGMRCGMALSPGIPIEMVRWLLPVIDRILIMTVEPGFGGQRYLDAMESKVAEARRMLDGWDGICEIEVDGGIAPSTIAGTHRAGASVFVVGSALWAAPTFRDAVTELHRATGGDVPSLGGPDDDLHDQEQHPGSAARDSVGRRVDPRSDR